jgi:hypothetical protein
MEEDGWPASATRDKALPWGIRGYIKKCQQWLETINIMTSRLKKKGRCLSAGWHVGRQLQGFEDFEE